MSALIDRSDAELDAMQDAIWRERNRREMLEWQLHAPRCTVAALEDAVAAAVDWIEPAYLCAGMGRDLAVAGAPNNRDCYAVAYPDGRIILCHAQPPEKKQVAALARVRETYGPEGLARARTYLSECLSEYLYYHGTRLGRRQMRHATTPGGFPWAPNRCVPNRIWRTHVGGVNPHARRAFFLSDREGAYCPFDPKAWPYGRWNRVLLPGEQPAPAQGRKRARR